MTGCRNWPSTQLRASYKGVSFEVDIDGRSGGRRIVTHEYPSREFWDNEDLGRQRVSVFVAGYTHGDAADALAERLFAVCSSLGPGRLVLPTRPPAMARCINVASTFTADEMGRIAVDMEFVLEAPGVGGIVSVTMLASAVASTALTALSSVTSLFNSTFNTLMRRFSPLTLVPAVGRDAAATTIELAATALKTMKDKIEISPVSISAEVEVRINLLVQRSKLFAYHGQRGDRIETAAFVRDQARPSTNADFASVWNECLALIDRHAVNSDTLASALREHLISFVPQATTPGPDCVSVRAEAALTSEVAAFVRRTSLLYYARAITRVKYESRREAISVRSEISRTFAIEMADIEDTEVERALTKARDAALDFMARAGAELPAVLQLEFKSSLPAAVIATFLYNDCTRDRELVERNEATHPLVMPPIIEAIKP